MNCQRPDAFAPEYACGSKPDSIIARKIRSCGMSRSSSAMAIMGAYSPDWDRKPSIRSFMSGSVLNRLVQKSTRSCCTLGRSQPRPARRSTMVLAMACLTGSS